MRRLMTALCAVAAATFGANVHAQTVEAPYDADYTVVDLGPVADLPFPSGGLTFTAGDPGTLIIGGRATSFEGKLYTVPVVRDTNGHIVGFGGSATFLATAPHVDGGIAYGPGGVLFVARFPTNEVSQFLPGSTTPDRVNDLFAAGVVPSPGGLNFVPSGFPGAGSMKIVTWEAGDWYTVALAEDGAGTYDVVSATHETTIPGGPEGFAYVPAGSPQFADNSTVLVSEWSDGNIAAYDIDGGGNPDVATRRLLVANLQNAEGAVIDPVSGDFLFSTFGGSSEHVYAVRGFAAPPGDDDEPDDDPTGVCVVDHPREHGYWHRQCMAVDVRDGGLRRGNGRGPRLALEEGFVDEVLPCVDALLQEHGLDATTCSALDPWPASDRCERALRDWAALAANVCVERVGAACRVDESVHGCDAASVGELLDETAARIAEGDCRSASRCLTGANPVAGTPPPFGTRTPKRLR